MFRNARWFGSDHDGEISLVVPGEADAEFTDTRAMPDEGMAGRIVRTSPDEASGCFQRLDAESRWVKAESGQERRISPGGRPHLGAFALVARLMSDKGEGITVSPHQNIGS